MYNNQKLAAAFCAAIKKFGESPDLLDTFEGYLSCHFAVWFEKYANTPDGLVSELCHFAEMEGGNNDD